MEIRIDPLEGQDAIEETFVAFRVGDVQKQSRFGASRTYKFPDPGDDRANFGRIEVFKRVGCKTVNFDTFTGDHQDILVPCTSEGIDKLGMRLFFKGKGDAAMSSAVQEDKRRSAKKRLDAASKYLSDHGLEEVLADAMREVIHEKPEDPHAFLSSLILKRSGRFRAEGNSSVTTLPPIPGASPKEPRSAKQSSMGKPPYRSMPKAALIPLPPIEEVGGMPSGNASPTAPAPIVEAPAAPEGSPPQTAQTESAENLRHLRSQAKGCFVEAMRDGTLASALVEAKAEAAAPVAPDPEAIRQMAREALIGAGQDGTLAAVLRAIPQADHSVDPRVRARDALLAAGMDGTLAASLESVKAERAQEKDAVRLQVRDALLAGGADGTLASTLESVQAPRPWYELIPSGPGYEQFQELAKALAARDKQLQELRELLEKRKASKEAKLAAAAQSQSSEALPQSAEAQPQSSEAVSKERPNALMPSVGTWLGLRPQGAPVAPVAPDAASVAPAEAAAAPVAPVPPAAALAAPLFGSFRVKPSVGTWLAMVPTEEESVAPVPAAPTEESMAPVPAAPIEESVAPVPAARTQESMATVPAAPKAAPIEESVAPAPADPAQEETLRNELLALAGEATMVKVRNEELLDAFHAEILRKDQEIEELKRFLRCA
mmetsp:Transcript_96304/g.214553  ORF Transcript_96304/g.214553 Transcript_96304/m.214553 type:complete len:660 (+) Transcript_96304:119-2098(+)